MSEKLSGTEAMNQIHHILDGNAWNSDTQQCIANLVLDTGREIYPCEGDYDREELIELIMDDWAESSTAKELIPLLKEGCKGLANMSYSELLKQAQDAGLIDEED